MANAVYPLGKDQVLGAKDLSANNVFFWLVSSGVYNAAHSVWSQISSAAITAASSPSFAGGTLASGKFTTGSASFGTVATGSSVDLVMIISSTNVSVSPLIAYYDTFSTGTHIVTNGGTVTLGPDGTSGWFTM